MNYVGYQNEIGFKINILKHISPYEIEELTSLDSQESYELSRIMELVYKIKGDMQNNFLWYMFDELRTNEVGHPLDLIGLLYYEKLLKKLGVISTIDVFLMKDNTPISLLEASSGELSFITSLVFISTVIEGEHLTVKDYASQLHISVSSLNRLCKTKLRISPKAIIHKRLECGAKRKLIYTKQSIESIAYALGFKDAGYFCRFFKRSTGATASEFRDSHTFS